MTSDNTIHEKLYNDSLDVFSLIGIYSIILFSKEIFKTNSQVADFVKKTMNLDLSNYIIKSRTLIAAKAIKNIINYDPKEQKQLHEKCKKYFNSSHITPVENKKQNSKKKKSENEKLFTWLEGLKNDK